MVATILSFFMRLLLRMRYSFTINGIAHLSEKKKRDIDSAQSPSLYRTNHFVFLVITISSAQTSGIWNLLSKPFHQTFHAFVQCIGSTRHGKNQPVCKAKSSRSNSKSCSGTAERWKLYHLAIRQTTKKRIGITGRKFRRQRYLENFSRCECFINSNNRFMGQQI